MLAECSPSRLTQLACAQDPFPKPRGAQGAKRKCGYCGETGHNVRRCPKKMREAGELENLPHAQPAGQPPRDALVTSAV